MKKKEREMGYYYISVQTGFSQQELLFWKYLIGFFNMNLFCYKHPRTLSQNNQTTNIGWESVIFKVLGTFNAQRDTRTCETAGTCLQKAHSLVERWEAAQWMKSATTLGHQWLWSEQQHAATQCDNWGTGSLTSESLLLRWFQWVRY